MSSFKYYHLIIYLYINKSDYITIFKIIFMYPCLSSFFRALILHFYRTKKSEILNFGLRILLKRDYLLQRSSTITSRVNTTSVRNLMPFASQYTILLVE